MNEPPRIRRAERDDWAGVAALLRSQNLPTDGLTTDVDHLFVLEERGKVVGAVGFELYPPHALLRSLVVDPGRRGTGQGARLLRVALDEAARAGAHDVYGLTTTIPDWLLRLGFQELPREALPADVHRSQELRGACPASARAFRRGLDTSPPSVRDRI